MYILAMIPQSLNKFRKIKKRRVLVISASGMQGGIQSLYLGLNGGTWEIISHAFMPYSQKIASLIEKCAVNESEIKISEFGWLDYKLSSLFVECAKTTLAQMPSALKPPHYIILNKPGIWKGETGEKLQQSHWNVPVGDAQFVASTLGVPVITDFIRHNILAGGPGVLPHIPGNFIIASKCTGIVVFINIGVNTRISIIDTSTNSLICDSDSGPGNCLLNKTIQQLNSPEGFDRDGSFAAQGEVNGLSLNKLAADPWFLKPSPKQASTNQFKSLLDDPSLQELSPSDLTATVTALSAKTAYDFFRREYRPEAMPASVYVSGGGSHNLTMIEYLSTYFDPLPVKSIEELGIPSNMRIPLALGLSVDSFLTGTTIPWETGNNPRIDPVGRWVVP